MMNLLAPLGLGLLLLLPIIFILHMLQVRRQQFRIPSIHFWRQATREIREQPKLRRPPFTLLLLLQLLAAALLAFGLSRPQVLGVLAGGEFQSSHTIVLIDASASMLATDGGSTRFSAAKDQVATLLNGLDPAAAVSLIRMGVTPRLLYSGEDLGLARVALNSAEPGSGNANVREAFRLANSLVKPNIRNQIVLVSDLNLAPEQRDLRQLGQIQAALRVIQVAGPTANRAVTTLAARPMPGSSTRYQIFARVANFSSDAVTTTVRAIADGLTMEPRELRLNPDSSRDLRWELPPGTTRVEVRVAGDDGLAADDVAQIILPTQATRRVVLVSAQPETLRRALTSVPGTDVQVVAPKSYVPEGGAAVTVFEDFMPPQLPSGAILAINPPRGGPIFDHDTQGTNTRITRQANSRLLDAVDLSNVTISQASKMALPAWANEIIGASVGPLLFEGTFQNSPIAVMTFKLSDSNLPSRVGFPILITNLINYLAPEGLPPEAEPGQPIVLRAGPQVASLTIQRPSGMIERFGGSGNVIVYANTEEWGRYLVSEAPASGGNARERYFTVNAGSDSESDLRLPREPQVNAVAPGQIAAGPPRGREIWPLLGLVALGLLVFEWWVAHR